MAISISVESREYIHVSVTADVTLDTQTVEFAFTLATTIDDTATWIPAEWEGAAGTTRTARLLIGSGSANALSVGNYTVWVRITDLTEAPVRSAGTVKVT